MEPLLDNYKSGLPDKKPDVLKQLISIEEERRRQAEKHVVELNSKQNNFILQIPGKEPKRLSNEEIKHLIESQHVNITNLYNTLQEKDKKILQLNNTIKELNNTIGSWKLKQPNGNKKQLSGKDIANILKQLQHKNAELQKQIQKTN